MNNVSNKIAIIGGGPAGIQAALTLNRWGLDVMMFTRPLPDCPNVRVPLLNEMQRPTVDIARSNIQEFHSKHIQTLVGDVTAIWNKVGNGFFVECQSYLYRASHIIIATGAPGPDKRLDLRDFEDLSFDGEGRIITDDNYSTEYHRLYVIGEAASDYVRTLSCALGMGDGVARMIARQVTKSLVA